MPASSQGLPTSGMRLTRSTALLAALDLDRVYPRAVRRVAVELLPALHGALAQLLLAADHLELSQSSQT